MTEMEQKKQKGGSQTPLLVVLVIAVLACLVVCSINLYSTAQTAKNVDMVINGDEDVAQEDDVTIAEDYVIKSTTQISDAYKSGNDSSLSDRDKETLQMASDILDEIITDGMTKYDKEKAVYDWMCANLKGDSGLLTAIPTADEDSDNPYGVLKNHKAVCVGYATTFRMFMQMMDIECMVVHNSQRYHSWDLVKLDDDNWYHVDIYSDVDNGGNYANFNMTDEQCYESHDSWNTDIFPAAEGIEYNYAYQNSEKIKDVYKIPAKVLKAVQNDESSVYLNLGSDVSDDDLAIANYLVTNISEKISLYNDYIGISGGLSLVNGEYLVVITINNYLNNEDAGLSDEDMEKVTECVDKAFEKYYGESVQTYDDYSYDDTTSYTTSEDDADWYSEDNQP